MEWTQQLFPGMCQLSSTTQKHVSKTKKPQSFAMSMDETGEVTSCPGSKETSKASIRLEERSAASRSLGGADS